MFLTMWALLACPTETAVEPAPKPPPTPAEPAPVAKQKSPITAPGRMASMAAGPVIVVDGAKGCQMEIDGVVVEPSIVQSARKGQPVHLPFRLKALEVGDHTFQVVGDAEPCVGHEPVVRKYDGRLVMLLPFNAPK